MNEHDRHRALVLSIDDLSGAAREEATRHLETCASCRELVRAIDAAERGRSLVGSLPEAAGPLPEAARFAERRSLEALLRKVPDRARPQPRARWVPWSAFVAAAAVLFLLYPTLGDRSRTGLAVDVIAASGPRGTSAPMTQAGGARAVRAGDPLVLSIRSSRPAHLAIVRLDPAGSLVPLAVGKEAFRVEAGVSELPPPRDPPWLLPNAPGSYTFFVVELTPAARESDTWIEAAQAALLDAPERSRREAVRSALSRHAGPTQLAAVEVLP